MGGIFRCHSRGGSPYLFRDRALVFFKNWTEAGNVWALVEDYGSKVSLLALTFLLIPMDPSINSAATESPLASAIAFCNLRAFSR